MSLARFLCAKTREITWPVQCEHFIFIHVSLGSRVNDSTFLIPRLNDSLVTFDL